MARNHDRTGRAPDRRDPTMGTAFEAARLGYNDALAGRPFADRYEGADRVWQGNYEIGRFWAVSFQAAKEKPPAWREGVKLPRAMPEAVERVCNLGSAPTIPFR